MSNKYAIRRKTDRSYSYYSATGLDGWDIRIDEALVYDSIDDAIADATAFKTKGIPKIEVVAVKVSVTLVRARDSRPQQPVPSVMRW